MDAEQLARNVKVERVLSGLRFTVPLWLLIALVGYGIVEVRHFLSATEQRFLRLERDTAKATMILDQKFPEESAEAERILRRVYRTPDPRTGG